MDLVDLAANLNLAVSNVVEEEQKYLDFNVSLIKGELEGLEQKLPYPEVRPYDVATDYDEIAFLQYQKRKNHPYWEKINQIRPYEKADPLYIGHLQMDGRPDYFFMDTNLPSKKLSDTVWLISAVDSAFDAERRAWRFPKGKSGVLFSRNVRIEKKKIINVDPIYDTSSKLVSSISDSYLRNALIRNKRQPGIVSIIQTIQEKQDEIMTASPRKSFIVQGCAGSGKTVVLLNRLRYLIFNKMLPVQYCVLVPSEQFKRFIWKAAMDYRIDVKSICTYAQYYAGLSSSKNGQLSDESILPESFLAEVYSENFVRECYQGFIDWIYEKTETLIDYCENKINVLIAKAVKELTVEQKRLNEKYHDDVLKCVVPIKEMLDGIDCEKTEPKDILNAAKLYLGKTVQRYQAERARIFALQFTVTEEEVWKYDQSILIFMEELRVAKEKAAKSNVFTRAFRYRALAKAREEYESRYREIETKLIARKRQSMLDSDLDVLKNGVTIDDVKDVVREMEQLVDDYESKLAQKAEQIAHPQEYSRDRYQEEGAVLSKFLHNYEEIKSTINENVRQLKTCKESLEKLFVYAYPICEVFMALDAGRSKKEETKQQDAIKLFVRREMKDRYGFFQMMLMNICKSFLLKKFGVTLSDTYKHYAFLSVYFSYLVRGGLDHPSNYIFIDEAQDLSSAELNLIYKLNSEPVMNLFGDVNQVITKYGMHDWSQISFIPTKYILSENFRNTNQVVDYCNRYLPSYMAMAKVGVEMDEVKSYDTAEELLKQIRDFREYSIIVKDAMAKEDAAFCLKEKFVADDSIYTAKESKGLEFYKIIVFCRDMTDNEKYIAYTRSLNQLIVVKDLPHYESHNDSKLLDTINNG